MSDYSDGCAKHKSVRAGIIEQRTVPNTKKLIKGDWLAVLWYKGRWNIWGEYKLEADALKVVEKKFSYWPMSVVSKEVYDLHYRKNHLIGVNR